MVNGTHGRPNDDWMYASEQFVKEFPDKIFVYCGNQMELARDGVDVMGERLAKEVIEVIKRKPNMRKISFIAYSTGGLVARYAIGRLYKISEDTVCGLEAMNFVTLATPHLGLSGHGQVPFFFGNTIVEKVARTFAPYVQGKTGQHLFLTDGTEQTRPLLINMVKDECNFMSALRTFKRRVAYSNVVNDYIGWRSASIRGDNSEHPKWEDKNEKYPHIVYEEDCQASEAIEDNNSNNIQEMVRGLSRVSWQKVYVSFNSGPLKHHAHKLIQVTDQSKYIEGADVIAHLIDHFLT